MKKKYIAASLAALCAAGGAMTVHAEDMPALVNVFWTQNLKN